MENLNNWMKNIGDPNTAQMTGMEIILNINFFQEKLGKAVLIKFSSFGILVGYDNGA